MLSLTATAAPVGSASAVAGAVSASAGVGSATAGVLVGSAVGVSTGGGAAWPVAVKEIVPLTGCPSAEITR